MLDKKNNLLAELDSELDKLEKFIEVEKDENKLIELRIRKKELWLQKLELEQYRESNY